MGYEKSKGRKSKRPPFAAIPHRIIQHPNFGKLSAHAVRLLVDMSYQYRGANNGDLMAAYSVLKHRGWRSPSTLSKSLKELIHFGLIQLTRQGGKHKPSLYALTWEAIDECGGKLEIPPCRTPSNLWKVERDPLPKKQAKKIKKGSRNAYQSSRNVYQLTKNQAGKQG